MSEKRFTFHHDVDGIDYIQDETNGFCFICDELLCNLLNKLSDENKQLKNRLNQAIHEISDHTCTIKQLQDKIDVKEALLKQYEEENEQLKQRIKES